MRTNVEKVRERIAKRLNASFQSARTLRENPNAALGYHQKTPALLRKEDSPQKEAFNLQLTLKAVCTVTEARHAKFPSI